MILLVQELSEETTNFFIILFGLEIARQLLLFEL